MYEIFYFPWRPLQNTSFENPISMNHVTYETATIAKS